MSKSVTGQRESEIEVTPEMTEAGVDELLSHPVYADARGDGPSMVDWRAAVEATYRVMNQEAPRS